MSPKPKINPSLKHAITFALAYQIPLLLMALFVGCGNGIIGLISSFASISFWAGIIIIIYRRRLNPTKFDLFIVRVGYLPLCVISTFLSHWIWRFIILFKSSI